MAMQLEAQARLESDGKIEPNDVTPATLRKSQLVACWNAPPGHVIVPGWKLKAAAAVAAAVAEAIAAETAGLVPDIIA